MPQVKAMTDAVRKVAHPLTGMAADDDRLMELVGNVSFVLIE